MIQLGTSAEQVRHTLHIVAAAVWSIGLWVGAFVVGYIAYFAPVDRFTDQEPEPSWLVHRFTGDPTWIVHAWFYAALVALPLLTSAGGTWLIFRSRLQRRALTTVLAGSLVLYSVAFLLILPVLSWFNCFEFGGRPFPITTAYFPWGGGEITCGR